jgi:hypothetical protein
MTEYIYIVSQDYCPDGDPVNHGIYKKESDAKKRQEEMLSVDNEYGEEIECSIDRARLQ